MLADLKPFHEYEMIVERLLIDHPTRWKEAAAAMMESDTGERIVREQRVGRMWNYVIAGTTQEPQTWYDGAAALLNALGGGAYSEHAVNAVARTHAATDETLRWLPLVLDHCKQEGPEAVERFWRENGVRVLATVMGEDPPENITTFFEHAKPDQDLGGGMTWAEHWLGLYLGGVGGERDGQVLERLVQWGVDLEQTSQTHVPFLELAILRAAEDDIGSKKARDLVDIIITAGADWTALYDAEQVIPKTFHNWIAQHPRVRHAKLSEIVDEQGTRHERRPKSKM